MLVLKAANEAYPLTAEEYEILHKIQARKNCVAQVTTMSAAPPGRVCFFLLETL